MQNADLIKELDAILGDSSESYDTKDHARNVRTQLNSVEQYGGASKVLVGKVVGKTALWVENRVSFTLVEVIYTQGGETNGEQIHKDAAFIDCDNAAGVAAVLNTTPPYVWAAVDRKTSRIIATWIE